MAQYSLGRFYEELKRRKVFRVAAAYLVVGWILVEVASVVFPGLLLPDWSVRLLLALVILGFPIAVVVAWTVDIGPGDREDLPQVGASGSTDSGTPASPLSGRPESISSGPPPAGTTPAGTSASPPSFGPAAGHADHTPQNREIRSIAVLPLLNLSNDPENEYFSDGMSEELLNRLCRLPQLTVASRTSSFSFKGKDTDLRSVAEKLGVDGILEGSVRRSGERVRIAVQLIDGRSDRHVWSETYDRGLKDVFAVQDEIAQRIVQALEISLTPTQQRSLRARHTTEDMGAYDFYLRGRYFFYRADLESALEMFEKAIARDPEYALAWAGAADVHSWACLWRERTADHLENADQRSRRALDLAPDLAEAHASRGFALVVNRIYAEAEEEFLEAIALDPQLYESYYYAGRAYFVQGKYRQAVEMFEKAESIRPDDVAAVSLRQTALMAAGTPEEVRECSREVVRVTERHVALHPDDALALSRGANALAALGESERAVEWAERAYRINARICAYNVACALLRAGRTERALDVLEEHVRQVGVDLDWLEQDSDWDPVREHPRFRAIVESLR